MAEIKRQDTSKRMSQIVIHNDTVYLSGQVGTAGASVAQQTRDVLAKIEERLAAAGTDKNHLLQSIIWLKSMDDFAEMNAVWDAWVPEGHAPARACGSADLATPDFAVEITVIAALR